MKKLLLALTAMGFLATPFTSAFAQFDAKKAEACFRKCRQDSEKQAPAGTMSKKVRQQMIDQCTAKCRG